MQWPWQQTIVIARCTNITTMERPRLSPRPRFLRETIRPSVPWIAAWRDILRMEPQFPQILFFPHWQ
jgi:hypothetical protein